MPYRKKEETIKLKQDAIDVIREKYEMISPHLNERGKRLFAATEALALGYKGVTLASEATGLSRVTVTAGCKELKSGEMLTGEKVRKSGGGRKVTTVKQPDILDALTALIEPSAFGNPERPLQWTCKSQRILADELQNQGFDVSHMTVGTLLEELGYSLQSNKKSIEGLNHIDRDAQFEHISQKVISFQEQGLPVISVDTKKKELVGNYKNNGSAYRPKKTPVEVNVYDFPDKELGKVNPYGVYDISNNVGWVNLGIDHDTAEFAVESIRRWYFKIGKEVYPLAKKLLITADGGGSNGSRVRLGTEIAEMNVDVKTTMLEIIRSSKTQILSDGYEIYDYLDITKKQRDDLLVFDPYFDFDNFVAIYATTVWGSAKDGIVFTVYGIYFNEYFINYVDIVSTDSTEGVFGDFIFELADDQVITYGHTYLRKNTGCDALSSLLENLKVLTIRYNHGSGNRPSGKVDKQMNLTQDEKFKSNAIIHTASAAAGGIGAGLAQVPLSDASLIIPIQITMITSLGVVFGIRVTEGVAKGILSSMASAFLGRKVSQFLIGWVPGFGNAFNATTATIITEAVGWAAVRHFKILQKREGRHE